MLLTLKLIISIFSAFMMIVTIPILYRRYDSILVDIWFKLDNITELGKEKIRNYSLDTIKNIYEVNNLPSKKKIIVISILLNSLYAVVMYLNIPKPNFINNNMFVVGLFSFLIGGTIVMSIFEYYAYKINISILQKYNQTNKKNNILKGIIKLVTYMYILPISIAVIFMLIDKHTLGWIGTYIIYFSPLGALLYFFDIFESTLGSNRFFLLLSIISIYAPLIFFFTVDYFYVTIRKIILPVIEVLEKVAKYIQGNDNYENNIGYFIWILILIIIVSPILEILL